MFFSFLRYKFQFIYTLSIYMTCGIKTYYAIKIYNAFYFNF